MDDPLARLARLPLAAVAAALDRLVERPTALAPGLCVQPPGRRLAGPAATLLFRPSGPPGASAPLDPLPAALAIGPVAGALADLPRGAIACLSLGGEAAAALALWDPVAGAAARAARLAGALVDAGRAPEAEPGAPGAGLPVAAWGAALMPAGGHVRLVAAGEPVAIAGVVVRPGDLVLGDAAGVLAVPAGEAAAVAALAARIAAARAEAAGRFARAVPRDV
jgi:regulator of RNase E activity RraA